MLPVCQNREIINGSEFSIPSSCIPNVLSLLVTYEGTRDQQSRGDEGIFIVVFHGFVFGSALRVEGGMLGFECRDNERRVGVDEWRHDGGGRAVHRGRHGFPASVGAAHTPAHGECQDDRAGAPRPKLMEQRRPRAGKLR